MTKCPEKRYVDCVKVVKDVDKEYKNSKVCGRNDKLPMNGSDPFRVCS